MAFPLECALQENPIVGPGARDDRSKRQPSDDSVLGIDAVDRNLRAEPLGAELPSMALSDRVPGQGRCPSGGGTDAPGIEKESLDGGLGDLFGLIRIALEPPGCRKGAPPDAFDS